ncbi:MAG: hypothetical protein AB7F28_04030 [Candidatus Margulisiibacteriota bacterium]
MIETVSFDGQDYALILRTHYHAEGIQFFTPEHAAFQLGYMNRPKSHRITPHSHNPVRREIHETMEVLWIKSGKVRVDFYNEAQRYLQSRILEQGDVVLLTFGSHGFEMLEASEMIEVKQGPFVGVQDKTTFTPTLPETLDFGTPS